MKDIEGTPIYFKQENVVRNGAVVDEIKVAALCHKCLKQLEVNQSHITKSGDIVIFIKSCNCQ